MKIRQPLLPAFFLLTFSAYSQIAGDTLNISKEDTVSEKIAVFSITSDELESEKNSQDISGLLQSSRDVFASVAGYNLGSGRFRMRGYDGENTIVMMNGVRLNDLETGFASWSTWGGLNDVTRLNETGNGIGVCRHSFGGVGGFSNIEINAAKMRPGTSIAYSNSNRSYDHRTMLTHSTGELQNGWSFTVSGSKRYAGEGYAEGTFFDAWSYLLAVGKKINNQHSISLVGFGAPVVQGRQGLAVQEALDLAGTNYYNPLWGYQDGEKRNSKVSNVHEPMVMLSHSWKYSPKTSISSSVYYAFGRNGITGLNWYDASDPRPDYYRKLPSYYANDPEMYEQVTYQWENDVNTRQINWDQLYFANSKNLYTVTDANGIAGNNVTGNRSKYILEEYRTDRQQVGLNSVIQSAFSPKLFLSGGINAHVYKGKNFKTMYDLLGGDFWVDVDQFAEQLSSDPAIAQNDLNHPNRIVKEGDAFGYDYDLSIHYYEGFAQAEYTLRKFDFYAAATASQTTFWRTGNMKNGRFPDNSFGDSEKQSFTNYGLKGGTTYKITGRHYVAVNGMYLTRAPLASTSYLSPRTRDFVVPGLESENILSGDINYHIRYPKIRARLTFYSTQINNQVWARSFYHDVYRTFVEYTMTGVNYIYMGTEAGAEAKITSTVTATGAFAYGKYLWNSRPSATITLDNSAEVVARERTIYLKNYRIGGTPQTAASIGLRYNAPKYWYVGTNFNYFADSYLEVNPDRRTEEALDKFVASDPQWDQLLGQEKLDNAFTWDVNAGKSWRIKKYYIGINISVNNVLNTKDFRTGGFEQLRYDRANMDLFGPKYYYHLGRTYNAGVTLRF